MDSITSIWHGELTTEDLNQLNNGSLGEHLNIVFTEKGPDYLVATMPVNEKTKQPFGLLHGGASVALAETVGSVATWCCVNRETFIGVGIEINANHIKAVTSGSVKAVCRPLSVSGRLHIWDIKLYNEVNELCCTSRFTCMVVAKNKF